MTTAKVRISRTVTVRHEKHEYVLEQSLYPENVRLSQDEVPLRLKTAFRFSAGYEPISYVVEPVVRQGRMYGLTAATGTGKTALLISMAMAVATGRKDILGLEVGEARRVVYVAVESPDEVRMRLTVSAKRFDVLLSSLGHEFVVVEEECSPETLHKYLRWVRQNCGEIGLIIIDGFSAMFDGRDLNSPMETIGFLKRLRPLTELGGMPAVVIAMHPGKGARTMIWSLPGPGC